jgi:LmbE family N-acetylglucosaminyl deacetylase
MKVGPAIDLHCGGKRRRKWWPIIALVLISWLRPSAQIQPAIPAPDARYKADILLVVAHPDDDMGVSTYLARAALDEGKRVAVIFTTRGNSGPNAVGMEQGTALADEREMEARRSLGARGINNIWFLHGQDTPTQDVLHSLATVGHGESLEEVVRLIRLTRPEVVISWLPAYVAGENHGDHQASSVIAVEGFDLAGDPTVFPSQVSAPRAHWGIANYGEGLHPWQAKKLYFFSDASHPEFLKGHGPSYSASEVSRTRRLPFSEINRLAWEQYATQVDFGAEEMTHYITMPEYLVLGKSLVSSSPKDDVWAGIDNSVALFHPAVPYQEKAMQGVSLQLGGPWAFYRQFYRVHGLESLETLVPQQTALSDARHLWIPLLLQNDTRVAEDVAVHAELPPGWTGDTKDRTYHLEPGSTYPISTFLTAPADSDQAPPQTLAWKTNVNGPSTAAQVSLSVYLEYNGVPQ